MKRKFKQATKYVLSISLILFISLCISLKSYAQEYQIVLGSVNVVGSEYLVGYVPKNDGNNFHKLRLEIFGGNWHASNLGLTTYYISSRDGLKVNLERRGGSHSKYQVKFYQSADGGYDIVLRITDIYPSLSIKSSMINSKTLFQEVKYFKPEVYSLEGAEDITSTIVPKIITYTGTHGEIGLNTSNISGYQLSVGGKVRAEEVKVYTGWADYVFEEDYHLKSLSEVEAHIKEYKHLPDVPSAKEVEENGVNVGETEAMLLRKIEELTLYTIEQEKEIKSLKESLDKVDNQDKIIYQLLERISKLEKNQE
ncbi:hypothetical protein [Flammeovirga sp. SJP92]|uniref:hypothetical protein n=1 Tax=Flammeovirga sp. SJP92 TaxID=1775430 RepID=UPI0007874369|nr:hypothetical protein [Flammeovirga sp. SJP92]KXX71238.1 hypothetical protein AVL50_09280 [Flammeovirga sp. SJP92]